MLQPKSFLNTKLLFEYFDRKAISFNIMITKQNLNISALEITIWFLELTLQEAQRTQANESET